MFGDRLKKLRINKGLTQVEMLDLIVSALIEQGHSEHDSRISISTYRNWEQNVAVPNSKYLTVIAPLLNTTTDYLLGVKVSELDARKSRLLNVYGLLNDHGQDRVVDYASDLQASGNYDRYAYSQDSKVLLLNVADGSDDYEIQAAAYSGEELTDEQIAEIRKARDEFQEKEKNNK